MNYEHSFLLNRFRIKKTQDLVEEPLYFKFILEIELIKILSLNSASVAIN